MTNRNKKRGSQKERSIVRTLGNEGYVAFRVCGSGGGTSNARPDIVAFNHGYYYGIEVKSSEKDIIYIDKKQIRELVLFCESFNATPIVAVAFSGYPVNYLRIKELRCTDGGNYKVTRGMLSKNNRVLI